MIQIDLVYTVRRHVQDATARVVLMSVRATPVRTTDNVTCIATAPVTTASVRSRGPELDAKRGLKPAHRPVITYVQGCSCAGSRGNEVPVNIFVQERRSGNHVSYQLER